LALAEQAPAGYTEPFCVAGRVGFAQRLALVAKVPGYDPEPHGYVCDEFTRQPGDTEPFCVAGWAWVDRGGFGYE
jgi:hypothetical protein